MNSSRFVNHGRNVFGTRLLQMNSNNIRKLCASTKFHYSTKQQQTRVQIYDSLAISTAVSTSGIQFEGLKELSKEAKDECEILRSLGLDLAVLRDVLVADGCKSVNLRRSGIPVVDVLNQSQPCLTKPISPL